MRKIKFFFLSNEFDIKNESSLRLFNSSLSSSFKIIKPVFLRLIDSIIFFFNIIRLGFEKKYRQNIVNFMKQICNN